MPEAPRARALLHGASVACLFSLLLPALERGLSPLVIPLAEPAAALLVLAVLCVPLVPLPPHSGRLVAAGAALTAALAAALHPTALTDILSLLGGTLWLGLAPRYLSRRAVTVGAAAGFAAAPFTLLARPGGTGALALAAVAAVLGALAFAWPQPAPPTPERRARGFRLRGLLALGTLLYLDSVLRQLPAAGSHVIGLMGATSLAAALLLALAPAPVPAARRELLLFAALVILAGTAGLAGLDATTSSIAARALLVVLVGRALVPAGGRRPRIQVSAAWITWAAATAVAGYVSSALALAVAAVTTLVALALLPRAAPWQEQEAGA